MATTKALDQLIQRSETRIRWLDKKIDGLEIPPDIRTRLAAGCLEVALEHQRAIVLLIANQLYGSAFAMVRIIFETYIRGVWLHKCATDGELDKFKNDTQIEFAKILAAVECLEGFEEGILGEVKRQSWKAMNSYVHTGYRQIVRRQTETTIEQNYDEEEIIESVNFANAIGALAAIAVCDIAGNAKLANEILERIKAE